MYLLRVLIGSLACLCSLWLTKSDYFGFGFTALNWKLLYANQLLKVVLVPFRLLHQRPATDCSWKTCWPNKRTQIRLPVIKCSIYVSDQRLLVVHKRESQFSTPTRTISVLNLLFPRQTKQFLFPQRVTAAVILWRYTRLEHGIGIANKY